MELLILLMRIYFFVGIGKLVWAGYLARQSSQDTTRALAFANYGALLLGMGAHRRAARCCEQAVELAGRSGSWVATGIAFGRLAGVAMFTNDLDRAREALAPSIAALKDASESWELLTLRPAGVATSGRRGTVRRQAPDPVSS